MIYQKNSLRVSSVAFEMGIKPAQEGPASNGTATRQIVERNAGFARRTVGDLGAVHEELFRRWVGEGDR